MSNKIEYPFCGYELGENYYEQRYRECTVNSLQKKVRALDMELVAQTVVETISEERDYLEFGSKTPSF